MLLLCLAARLPVQSAEPDRKALERIKANAEKGDAQAQLELGIIYGAGAGVPRDLGKAAKWHRKAADQGLARAQYQVGLDYSYGQGVKPNETEAMKWFRRAAQQGLVEAEYEMGVCFLSGRGVEPNGSEAVEWFRKAASQGSGPAEYQLGACYFDGTGVARNIGEGIKWIQSAAEKGVPAAQNKLGICYQKGEGLPKDYVQAYKWFALAAAQDDQHALDIKVVMATLESTLTKEQISEAQQLAAEFKPGQKNTPRSLSASVTSGNPKTGFVLVRAEDERCEVFVDGAFVGNPPARLKLDEGVHVVEVRKSGFRNFRRELKVISGSDLTLKAELERE